MYQSITPEVCYFNNRKLWLKLELICCAITLFGPTGAFRWVSHYRATGTGYFNSDLLVYNILPTMHGNDYNVETHPLARKWLLALS